MANALYTLGKNRILSGAVNFTSANLKAALVSSAYMPNLTTDEYFSTISATVLNTPQALANKAVASGAFDADDTTFTTVTAGSTAKAVVVYLDTGVEATSPLLMYLDTVTGFPLATNGGDITIQWSNGAYKIFSL